MMQYALRSRRFTTGCSLESSSTRPSVFVQLSPMQEVNFQAMQASLSGAKISSIRSCTEAVSQSIVDGIKNSGGKLYRYDPKTGVLTEYP